MTGAGLIHHLDDAGTLVGQHAGGRVLLRRLHHIYSQVAGRFQVEWYHVMAATVLVTVPVAIVFSWLQKYLICGMRRQLQTKKPTGAPCALTASQHGGQRA